jgi:carboxyl-terminal processing protease
MKISKKIIFSFCFILLLGAVFVGGFYLGDLKKQCQVCQPSEVDFSLFWQAWDRVQQKFVNRDNLDTQKMIYGAISGMVESLGDPYTVFFPPEESKMFKEDVKGTFDGVGMEIGVRKDQLQIISPLEGTPAQKAGLRAGDEILEINGTSTEGMTSDAAASLIRGKKGTQVTLNIFREGWADAKDFVLTRATIEVPSLKLEFKQSKTGEKIAYLDLYQFSAKANYDFSVAALDILNSDAKKIVLDLRNNPGGYLEVAQSIAGWFLQKGEVVVMEDFGREDSSKQEYRAEGSGNLSGYQIVVLINGGSASAAEILAGALRDDRGIQLVGEKSFGKGSVQELSDLAGGSSIKITVAKWLTPKGNFITDVGLEPDVKVEMTDKDISDGKDPQLDKAIEILESL